MKLIYPAFSKRAFYFRMHISKFVLEHDGVPLNPFMIHEYFMLDTVDRNLIRKSNNALIERADEVWVFGEISDSVAKEITLAKENGKPLRYFEIVNSQNIQEINEKNAVIEK